jgi:hypothetical protein
MPSLFDMPPLGVGFREGKNGLLGFGDISLNDSLGGTNTGLLRTATQLSGMDVIKALQQTLGANPQAVMVLTGTTGTTVQAAGTIGVKNQSGGLTVGGSFNGQGPSSGAQKPSLVK